MSKVCIFVDIVHTLGMEEGWRTRNGYRSVQISVDYAYFGHENGVEDEKWLQKCADFCRLCILWT